MQNQPFISPLSRFSFWKGTTATVLLGTLLTILFISTLRATEPSDAQPEPQSQSEPQSEPQSPNVRHEIDLPAWSFDRTDNRVFFNQYRNGGPILIAGGKFVEFDLDFPVSGKYRLDVFRAMYETRPLRLLIDGRVVGEVCRDRNTPSWNTSDAVWESEPSPAFEIEAGKTTTVRLETDGFFPHIVSLRFISENPIPDDWTPERPNANRLFSAATNLTALGAPVAASLPNPAAIRLAIEKLAEFGEEEYPDAERRLERLDSLQDEYNRLFAELYRRTTESKSLGDVFGKIDENSSEPRSNALNDDSVTAVYLKDDSSPEDLTDENSTDADSTTDDSKIDDSRRDENNRKVALFFYRLSKTEIFDSFPLSPEERVRFDEIFRQIDANLEKLQDLQRTALYLENPAIDFDRLLFVRRKNTGPSLGLPTNWQSNSSLPKRGYDDEIMSLATKRPQDDPVSLYKPGRDALISDLDLDFDGRKLMFSSVGTNDRWRVFEGKFNGDSSDSLTVEEMPLGKDLSDVDFYDSCYLPDGRIIVTSTAPMIGVPCVYGDSHVANNFLFDPENGSLRQLCFDQEHNWCPTVLPNGRVLYERWEYADTPHSNSRLLFSMNPDGTSQMEFYGSNSYWPDSIFYARPVPESATKTIAVIGGHHDNPRMGELVLFDPSLGRQEADGAIAKIPGYGKKVEPVVADGLTRDSWPKFLHPYPLSEDFFLVSAKLSPKSDFALYLVDVFDNIVPIREMPGQALVEPIPLRATDRPPTIPDRVDLSRNDANVFLADVYSGPGLKGIPKGTVKELRIFTYHFGYHVNGGLYGSIGADGPWDVKGVLGTVPVREDGSAFFRIPANLPIAIQPLDENGQSLALMRSWMTAMPGETLQCNGCHEPQNTAAMFAPSEAYKQKPSEITPYDPRLLNRPTLRKRSDSAENPRTTDGDLILEFANISGFAFSREIQPVLDKYCVSCHDGRSSLNFPGYGERPLIDLSGDKMITGWKSDISGHVAPNVGGRWSVAYNNLHRFVRRSGIESDYHLLVPMEFAANTTELVQILKANHYGVKLDPDSWERLYTWIDLNAPYHGSWSEITGADALGNFGKRRVELVQAYGGLAVDFENENRWKNAAPRPLAADSSAAAESAESQRNVDDAIQKRRENRTLPERLSATESPNGDVPVCDEASLERKTLPLPGGDSIELVRIPGQNYWMGRYEITNGQFRSFRPNHDSGVESRHNYQFGRRGYFVNDDSLPAVRLTWSDAEAFCDWLAETTGQKVVLPTEEEWEFAARAGATTPFWFGDFATDFAPYENLGDLQLKKFVANTSAENYAAVRVVKNPNEFDDWTPKDERFDDGNFLQTAPGSYRCNPFGLFDVHGNVAEWTRSAVVPGPFGAKTSNEANAEKPATTDEEKIVCGGSWYDRPYRGAAEFRRSYPSYQPVFDVGFRVCVEDDEK